MVAFVVFITGVSRKALWVESHLFIEVVNWVWPLRLNEIYIRNNMLMVQWNTYFQNLKWAWWGSSCEVNWQRHRGEWWYIVIVIGNLNCHLMALGAVLEAASALHLCNVLVRVCFPLWHSGMVFEGRLAASWMDNEDISNSNWTSLDVPYLSVGDFFNITVRFRVWAGWVCTAAASSKVHVVLVRWILDINWKCLKWVLHSQPCRCSGLAMFANIFRLSFGVRILISF